MGNTCSNRDEIYDEIYDVARTRSMTWIEVDVSIDDKRGPCQTKVDAASEVSTCADSDDDCPSDVCTKEDANVKPGHLRRAHFMDTAPAGTAARPWKKPFARRHRR